MSRIAREEGRQLFGADPAGYDRARPGHAERVYEVLVARCGLERGTAVLEIGPGTGQATRRLLELGAAPLVLLEPNPVLAAFLRDAFSDPVDVVETTIEDSALRPGSFGLAAAASSFHWVEEDVALSRIFEALHPGGWVALWWTLFGERFGEAAEPDAFIEATTPLLDGLQTSPTAGQEGRPPHALDAKARSEALARAGFVTVEHERVRWEASWDTAGIRALYGSFSPILQLAVRRREKLLDAIALVAERDFGGRVSRLLTSVLYTGRRGE